MKGRFVVINEVGEEIEEFDTMSEAEEYCEYKERWGA